MLQPKAGRISVELITESKTDSGFFLPETQKQSRVIKGKVVAIGKPIFLKDQEINAPCSVGDIAFFKRLDTPAYTEEGKTTYFPLFSDVLIYIRSSDASPQ